MYDNFFVGIGRCYSWRFFSIFYYRPKGWGRNRFYGFIALQAPAYRGIMSSALVEDRATLGSDPSATKAAYSMWTATCLLPCIPDKVRGQVYDYAGACNATNPLLSDDSLATIAIEHPLPVSEEYKTFLLRIHIRYPQTLGRYQFIFILGELTSRTKK